MEIKNNNNNEITKEQDFLKWLQVKATLKKNIERILLWLLIINWIWDAVIWVNDYINNKQLGPKEIEELKITLNTEIPLIGWVYKNWKITYSNNEWWIIIDIFDNKIAK